MGRLRKKCRIYILKMNGKPNLAIDLRKVSAVAIQEKRLSVTLIGGHFNLDCVTEQDAQKSYDEILETLIEMSVGDEYEEIPTDDEEEPEYVANREEIPTE